MPLTTGLAVGADVGGTKLVAGLVAADGSVLARRRRDTPAADPRAIAHLVAAMARELAPAGTPVGVGAAGLVDLDGVVRYGPNIAWDDFPLRRELSAELDTVVTVDNDANVAAWGEYRVGAGRNAQASMLMLTLGTGVGGGLVEHDQLMRGANGMGAEFGHILLSDGGPACSCGNRGCLEAFASGTAIGRVAREHLAAGRIPAGSRLRDAHELTGKTVTLAAHAGDAFAAQVLAECGFWLGVGIASLINALDPEAVVVGGGAMQAGELVLAPARRAASERVTGRAHRIMPPIRRAQLADDAGFVGAALLALAALPAAPVG